MRARVTQIQENIPRGFNFGLAKSNVSGARAFGLAKSNKNLTSLKFKNIFGNANDATDDQREFDQYRAIYEERLF